MKKVEKKGNKFSSVFHPCEKLLKQKKMMIFWKIYFGKDFPKYFSHINLQLIFPNIFFFGKDFSKKIGMSIHN